MARRRGLPAAAAVAVWALRRAGARRALEEGARVALPFYAPLLVLGAGALLVVATRQLGFPLRGPGGALVPVEENLSQTYGRISNEDFSAFGPLAIVAMLAASALAIVAYVRRRADARHLALALALPWFLVVISAETFWSAFLIRFFVVPVVFTAPLLARLFRGRATVAAYFIVAAITVTLTVTRDQSKPLHSPYGYGRPWRLSQQLALSTNSRSEQALAEIGFEQRVPPRACLGAVITDSDPGYLLYGPHLEHHVVFLPSEDPVTPALASDLSVVVLNTAFEPSVEAFQQAGWKIQPLGGEWVLATRPSENGGACSS